jgi:hypothetical protein
MQFFSDQNFKPEHLKKILKHYTLWLKYKIWIHSCFFNRNNHTNYSGSHIYRNTHPLFSGLWTLRYSYRNNHKMFFGLIKKIGRVNRWCQSSRLSQSFFIVPIKMSSFTIGITLNYLSIVVIYIELKFLRCCFTEFFLSLISLDWY